MNVPRPAAFLLHGLLLVLVLAPCRIASGELDTEALEGARLHIDRPSSLRIYFYPTSKTDTETRIAILDMVFEKATAGQPRIKQTNYHRFFEILANDNRQPPEVQARAREALSQVPVTVLPVAPGPVKTQDVLWTVANYEAVTGLDADTTAREVLKTPGLKLKIWEALLSNYVHTRRNFPLLRRTVEMCNLLEFPQNERAKLAAELLSRVRRQMPEAGTPERLEILEIWLLSRARLPLDGETVVLLAEMEQADSSRLQWRFLNIYLVHNAIVRFLEMRPSAFHELRAIYLEADPRISGAARSLLCYSERGFLTVWMEPRFDTDASHALTSFNYCHRLGEFGASAREARTVGVEKKAEETHSFSVWTSRATELNDRQREQMGTFLDSKNVALQQTGVRLVRILPELSAREIALLHSIAGDRALPVALREEAASRIAGPALDSDFRQERRTDCIRNILSQAEALSSQNILVSE